ncbi:MAG: AAA family ATPase [Ruminococcaceae bacterium]|nr:AAA family ATPase [Oscillospiraceae bacterium]
MRAVERLFVHMPIQLANEINRICRSRGVEFCGISEIRLRAHGRSSVIILGERIFLSARISNEDVTRTFFLICEGSVYAQRESIKDGYVTLSDGVRVGICGQARYDGGKLVGVSNVTSLVFRIPTAKNADVTALYSAWSGCKRGMLIYSPPGVGKTTALRALSAMIGTGRYAEQVAVVDERGEFIFEDYKNASVDILRGYKRADGMEIALRTLSPSVIVVDEIGRVTEAEAMLESLNSGVRVLASAHAGSYSELKNRESVKPFLNSKIFDVYAGISLEGCERRFNIERCVQ